MGAPSSCDQLGHLGFGAEDLCKERNCLWLLKWQLCWAFSLWGLQPPPERAASWVWGSCPFSRTMGLPGMRREREEGAGQEEEAGWGGASVQAEAELACPANQCPTWCLHQEQG